MKHHEPDDSKYSVAITSQRQFEWSDVCFSGLLGARIKVDDVVLVHLGRIWYSSYVRCVHSVGRKHVGVLYTDLSKELLLQMNAMVHGKLQNRGTAVPLAAPLRRRGHNHIRALDSHVRLLRSVCDRVVNWTHLPQLRTVLKSQLQNRVPQYHAQGDLGAFRDSDQCLILSGPDKAYSALARISVSLESVVRDIDEHIDIAHYWHACPFEEVRFDGNSVR